MRNIIYRVINRKTNLVVAEGKMSDLAKMFEVDKTAIWQAERRDSHFLRVYKIVKVTDEDSAR